MNWLRILGSGPVVAILSHAVTAGVTALTTAALAKGWLQPSDLATIGSVVVGVGNAVASGARSTTEAAAKKVAASGVHVVDATGQPVSTPTVWGKSVN